MLTGENNKVIKTAEKERISNLCSSGLYCFKKTGDFKEIFNKTFNKIKEKMISVNYIVIHKITL